MESVVVVEPVLLPLPPPGAVVLNEWLLRMPNHFGYAIRKSFQELFWKCKSI